MKAHKIIPMGMVLGCCAIVIAAAVERTGSGGDWSDPSMWDTNQVPGASDNVTHGTSASGLLTYDTDVNAANDDINDLKVTSGSSRALQFESGTSLSITNNFTDTTTNLYDTELLSNSSLTVGGTIEGGDWLIRSGALVTAGNIEFYQDTDWGLDGGTVHVTGNTSATSDAAELIVGSGGELEVDGDGEFHTLTISSGSADIAGKLTSFGVVTVSDTLTAGSAGGSSTPGIDRLFISNGDATIDDELRLLEDNEITFFGSSGTLAAGSLNVSHATSVIRGTGVSPALAMTVSGNVANASEAFSEGVTNWNTSHVNLTLDASGSQSLEAFSVDFRDVNDVNDVGLWMGLQKNGSPKIYNTRAWGGLLVASGATVNVADANTNTVRFGYTTDAIYVDGDVEVESGATLNLGSIYLYYTGSLTNNGTINGTTIAKSKVCFGDFDEDGDVDLGDFATFSLAYTGANTDTNDVQCDADLDGDVDLSDNAAFQNNFTGTDNPCPTTIFLSKTNPRGEYSVDAIADWQAIHATADSRAAFAEILEAAAITTPDVQSGLDMLELADKLRAINAQTADPKQAISRPLKR